MSSSKIKFLLCAPSHLDFISCASALTVTKSPAFVYFSVGGNGLDFDISVTICSTVNCSNERAYAASISSKNHDVNLKTDEDASNVPDLSVFVGVGVGLATLALGTYAVINGLRKIAESVDEPSYQGLQSP